MYIGYISTFRLDLTINRQFDPSLTFDDLYWVMIYTYSKFVKNFRLFKVYVIYIGSLDGALEPFSSFRAFGS